MHWKVCRAEKHAHCSDIHTEHRITTLRLSRYVPVVSGLDLRCSCSLWKQMWSVSHPSHQYELVLLAWRQFCTRRDARIFLWGQTYRNTHIFLVVIQKHMHQKKKRKKKPQQKVVLTHRGQKLLSYFLWMQIPYQPSVCAYRFQHTQRYTGTPTQEGENTHKHTALPPSSTRLVSIICPPGALSVMMVEY